MVINVGDAKRLNGNSTNSQQELTQQQQWVDMLGGVVLLAAALILRFGVEVL